MKSISIRVLWLLGGITCLASIGNGQDGGASGGSVAATAYRTQGSVTRNQRIRERERKQALQAAREMKALKAAMAEQARSQRQTGGYATAEEFLKANPPSEPQSDATGSGAPTGAAPVTTGSSPGAEVPSFRETGEPSEPSQPDGSAGGGAERVAAPDNPYAAPGEQGQSPAPNANEAPDASAGREAAPPPPRPAPRQPRSRERERDSGGGLLARIFGGDDDERSNNASPPPRRSAPEAPPASDSPGGGGSASPQPVEAPPSGSIPEPPPESAPAASSGSEAPESGSSEPAGIFVTPPDPSSDGESATVSNRAEADVEGVTVTLYEGTEVGVIEEEGGLATIRLPDGRVGQVPTAVLGR